MSEIISQDCKCYNEIKKQSYQNSKDKTNSNQQNIKVNDIVKANNIHYILTYINEDTFIGVDMYGNSATIQFEDVQSIIFDSSKQTNIYKFIYDSRLQDLQESLKDISRKLKSPMTGLSNINTLKKLKKSILKKIADLKKEMKENISIQESNSLFQEMV